MEGILKIVCYLWGNWPRPFEYVEKLYGGYLRNVDLPSRFICFTDREEYPEIPGLEFVTLPKEVIALPLNFKKIYSFSKDNPLISSGDRIIVMDLDSVIVRTMDELLSYEGLWCSVQPFITRNIPRWTGGGLLSFKAGEFNFLWDELIKNVDGWAAKCEGGKERLYFHEMIQKDYPDRWQNLFPGKFIGYKRHIRRENGNRLPPDACFVAFHGRPRPHEVERLGWMKKHWKV